MIQTACPLDCWDACAITCDPAYPTKLTSTLSHPTSNGSLCALLSKHIHEATRIKKARVDGVETNIEDALKAVADALNTKTKKILGWSGSGNLGVMQSITDLLISKLDGTLTKGSLCDGAGQAGIKEGRGYNRLLPPEQIAKAEVIVAWGRNVSVTNNHLLPFIKGKTLIVIDPVATPFAKSADMHIQIQPRTDLQLALLLSRFIYIEGAEDKKWLDAHTEDFEDFYELTQKLRIKQALTQIGISLGQIGEILNYIIGKRVVFLVGVGVQKYSHGNAVFRSIDALAATLGLFGKEGCGVSFLGNSKQKFDDPFSVTCKRVSISTTAFEDFDTVLVRGGNPAASMPNTNRVIESLKQVKNLIYFGLYENETSKLARIVIPAKSFLEKNDIRLSYGHQYVTKMNKVIDSDIGISEYEFTRVLFEMIGLGEFENEKHYLNVWEKQLQTLNDYPVSPDYQTLPYADGFGVNSDELFEFMNDYEDDYEEDNEMSEARYWLLSPKGSKSLNTQFIRGEKIIIPQSNNFKNGEKVRVVSEYGQAEFIVKFSGDLRDDCVIIHAGSKGLNRLTPPTINIEGNSPCYQEVKVILEHLER